MTFFQRIKCYCKEQLEPGPRLFLSLIITFFIQLLILLPKRSSELKWQILIPAISTFLLLLYYRISDEFKDAKTDALYFPDRPLPSGRLFLSDLRLMLAAVSISGLLLNLAHPEALYEYLVAFIFTFAMGKWFFLEDVISKNRLLAFFTHAPVGLVLYWYAEVWLLNFEQVEWSLGQQLSVIGFIVLPGLSWEVLRKTYLPQDEKPGYQIYSTMLGFRGALAFAAGWIVLTAINNFFLVDLHSPLEDLKLPLLIVNALLLAVVITHAKKPLMKNLKPVAEAYMAVHLMLPLGLLIYRFWRQDV